MLSVNEIAREIVVREGGYVNDPDDLGGATKYGVTIHTMRNLGLDLNKDGRVTSSDVKLLTVNDAVEIFKTHYYIKPKIDKLPKSIQVSVFDMQVNAGSNAIKILQRLMKHYGEDVTVDGVLGPQSIGAAKKIDKTYKNFNDNYGIARRNYYFYIADKRPKNRKYAMTRSGNKGGWIKRAEEFISSENHMTMAEFKRRTSKWA